MQAVLCKEDRQHRSVGKRSSTGESPALGVSPGTVHEIDQQQLRDIHQHQGHQNLVRVEAGF